MLKLKHSGSSEEIQSNYDRCLASTSIQVLMKIIEDCLDLVMFKY